MGLLLIVTSLLFMLGPTHSFLEESAPENPESTMSAAEMIAFWGYPSEEYKVITEDGYILTLNRIPHGKKNSNSNSCGTKPKPVVLLQHGIFASSADWVSNPSNISLPFILADSEFDVWMGNSRGNTLSSKNIYYPTNSVEFWAFSFDEMAKYDLPAMINFILEKTGQKKLKYVGHSQGTSSGFAAFSTNPELAKKIQTFYALAPVTFAQYSTTPLKKVSLIPVPVLRLILGYKMIFQHEIFEQLLATELCPREFMNTICKNALFLICGFDSKNLNTSRLDVYLSHNPAGASVQNLFHWNQLVKTGRFEAYDWGSPAENIKHYGQSTPPQYDLTKVEVPVAVWNGGNDWVADPRDVEILISKLPNVIHHKTILDYNHLDFIWGENTPNKVYHSLVSMMNENIN